MNNTTSHSLYKVIEKEIQSGCKSFLIGTHGEFDRLSLNICRNLRQKYKDIKIEVVITSLKAIEKQFLYDDEFGKVYDIPYSDVSTIMYEIEEEHYKRQITVSNQKMIDDCDTLICYINKNRKISGAKIAYNYAKRKGLNIINIYEENYNLN